MVNNKLKLVKSATAFVIGAAVLTGSFAAAGSDTAFAKSSTSVKVSNGKLVYKSTGKVVKGYKTYNKALYKDGKKLTGLYKKTYYKAGKKATGTYKSVYYKAGKAFTGVTNKTYYKAGKKATGTYKNVYYKSGKAYTGVVNKTYYKAGKKATGLYKGVYYKTGKAATGIFEGQLYVSGNLNKGLTVYKEQLYKDGSLNKGLVVFKEQLYKDAVLNKGLIEFEGKFYFDAALANDTYTDQGVERAFENGVEVGAKVKSVEAINATQLKVTFNRTVDADAAEVLTNYSVAGTNPTSAVVADDAKSVVVTFTSASTLQGTAKTVTVLPITLDANDEQSTAKFVSLLTFKDEVKPEIAEVTSTTAGTTAGAVTVKASEPIASATAKVDGVNYAISFNNTDTATISGLQLDATKSHTIELLNVTDLAGNKTISTTKTFNVTVDKNAPEVTLSSVGDKTVVLEFNKDMDVASVQAAFALNSGNVKDETLNAINHVAVTQIGNSKKKFAVQLNDSTLYDNKTSRTLTVVLPATLKDGLGNTVAATTKQVTLSKDTVAPTYTSYKVKKNANGEVTAIEFNFSEELAAKTAASITPTVVKSNGEAVSLTNILGGLSNAAVTVNDKKVVFNATTPAKITGNYTFTFAKGSVTDTAVKANDNAAFSATVDFGAATATDLTLPTNAVTKTGTRTYEVNFGTAVKGGAVAGSATDTSNYTLAGKALPEGTTIVLKEGSNQTKALITLPAGAFATDDANALISVSNVQTLAGDTFKLYTQTIAVVDTLAPVLKAAGLTADNKLAVDFGEVLTTSPAITDLVVKINGKTLATTPAITAGSGSDAGKYLIDLSSLVKVGTGAVEAAPAKGSVTAGTIATVVNGTLADATGTETYTVVDNNGTLEVNDGAGTKQATLTTGAGSVTFNGVTFNITGATAGATFSVSTTAAVTAASATPSYIDLDGSNSFDATKDIKIADGAVSGFKFSTSSAITSVTVSTKDTGALTGADNNGNTLTNGTTVTAK
ncbi:hypothetical protein ACFVP8_00865 [Viridibacillus arvi]|uniref:hypothetical protein n=1 Tax=Viridibacillus arvi TaxID=263475 RepID=UPI00367B9B00